MRYDTISRGTEDVGGKTVSYRSRWEINWAYYLEWLKKNKQIKDWEYEPERYKFYVTEGNTKILIGTYLPDFRITNNDGTQYIDEIKGYKQGMRKIQRMKKHYPEIPVHLIDRTQYNAVKRQVGKMLNWQ